MKAEEIPLEKLQLQIRKAIPKEMLSSATIEVFQDLIHRCLVVELRKAIWAEKLDEERAIIKYPDGPWQWIKKWLKEHSRLFKWLKVRYKVHEVVLKKYAAYPKLAMEIPEAQEYVIKYTKKEDTWTETKS